MIFAIILSIILFGLVFLSVVPALPIVPAQFFLVLLFSILSGFSFINGWELILFGLIAALSLVVDYSAGAVGAKIGGAHRWSVFAGVFGGLVGTLAFPPFGAFIGIPVFVFFSEMYIKNNPTSSVKTAGLSLLGAIGGVFMNGFLAFITAVLFLVFVF